MAAFVLAVGSVVISTVSSLVLGVEGGFVFMLLLAGIGGLVGHVMGSVALPLYYRRIGFSKILHGLFPIVYIVSGALIAYSLFVPFVFPVYFAPIIAVVWGAVGFLVAWRGRKKLSNWGTVGRAPIKNDA
jgi:hypothetical protein